MTHFRPLGCPPRPDRHAAHAQRLPKPPTRWRGPHAAASARVLLFALLILLGFVLSGCALRGTLTRAVARDSTESVTRVHATGSAADTAAATFAATTATATDRSSTAAQQDPPTAGQRVGAIVGSVGGLLVVGVILLVIFAPGALAAFAISRARAMRRALTETVAAVKHSQAVDKLPELHDALRAAQSPATRALVEEVKRDA